MTQKTPIKSSFYSVAHQKEILSNCARQQTLHPVKNLLLVSKTYRKIMHQSSSMQSQLVVFLSHNSLMNTTEVNALKLGWR